MREIKFRQAIFVNDKFNHWHYWGFLPDLSFVGPDSVNGLAHALANSHPFVCPDKNGKDVYAGDRIKRISGEPCIVEWCADELRYILHNNDNYYDIDILEMEQGFELIEE